MDAHGQVGPDKPDFAADVSSLTQRLLGQPVFVSLTENGLRTDLVLVLRDDLNTVGPGAREPDGVSIGGDYICVAVIEKGAYWFILGAYHEPSYVAEKLGLRLEQATTVAELLTRIAVSGRPTRPPRLPTQLREVK